ncbi:MAG: glycosyltransferase family 2 protein [Actinobacteria bacterium]|nr:glycosyltransferase family 2 protein [Actinomycetota bacterium]
MLRRLWSLGHQLQFARRRMTQASGSGAPDVSIAVVVPLLDEACRFGDCVAYFRQLVIDANATLFLVTSDREFTINAQGSQHDTAWLAAAAADGDRVKHLHVSDAQACKGDQLNVAVAAYAATARDPRQSLVVVYDVDSRPESTSLVDFGVAARAHPSVNVFHQSARFDVPRHPRSLGERVADAGALLQNRFVLSTEIPRLRARHPAAGLIQRVVSRLTWIGVTGHGVAARASFLRSCPFPGHQPMEDLRWSFVLAVRGEPIVVIPSFDRSEAPATTGELFRQMERWFGGPAGAIRHARTSTSGRTWWRGAIAVSTLVSIAEWLSAAFALPLVGYAVAGRKTRPRALARALCAVIACEVIVAEFVLGSGSQLRRAQRVVLYPVANSVFGIAGWSALARSIVRRRTKRA